MTKEFSKTLFNFLLTAKKAKAEVCASGSSEPTAINMPFSFEDISSLVTEIETRMPNLKPGDVLSFGEIEKITFSNASGESFGFQIETKGNSFFLRIGKPNLKQSYIAERHQFEILETQFAKKMQQLRLSFPHFIHASDKWCVTDFESGNELQSMTSSLYEFIDDLEKFLARQPDPIFQNIGVDLMPSNILQRNDGTFCWLDPFYLTK